MAMTKDDYEKQGRESARKVKDGSGVEHPFSSGHTSWQARHYWLGYSHELQLIAPVVKLTARQEHIRLLKAEMATKSCKGRRLTRIWEKIAILQVREMNKPSCVSI
jgi:hypothetical protein